jgi:hypothetical protein
VVVGLAAAGLVVGPATIVDRAAGGEATSSPLEFQGTGQLPNGTVRIVPDGVDEIFVDVRGGRGGTGNGGIPGGPGGRVLGVVDVEPGSRLELHGGAFGNRGYLHEGGQGIEGAGGGGSGQQTEEGRGGGAGGGTGEIRVGSGAQPEDAIVVAGGGGGGAGGAGSGSGGAGGGEAGEPGTCGVGAGGGATATVAGEGGAGADGGLDGAAGGSHAGGAGGATPLFQGGGGGGGGNGVFGGGGGGGAGPTGAGCGGGGTGLAPEGTLAQTGVSEQVRVYLWTCPAPCTPTFPDVSRSHPFFWEVELARWIGTTTGYEDGGFHPSAPISRAAMAAFLFRAFSVDPDEYHPPATSPFPDVSTSHPFYEEVAWLAEQGVSNGYQDGTFRPAAPITRQSMSAFLQRAAGEDDGFVAPAESSFSDVGPDHPFAEAISWMAEVSITTGYEDGTFRPLEPVTRQAMAAFMLRYAPFTPHG